MGVRRRRYVFSRLFYGSFRFGIFRHGPYDDGSQEYQYGKDVHAGIAAVVLDHVAQQHGGEEAAQVAQGVDGSAGAAGHFGLEGFGDDSPQYGMARQPEETAEAQEGKGQPTE